MTYITFILVLGLLLSCLCGSKETISIEWSSKFYGPEDGEDYV